jgi:cytidyltransferase-like protein
LSSGSTASKPDGLRIPTACSTALFIGRYQPFHPGHQRLIEEGLRRVGQVCIAVRDTHGTDEKNPLPFFAVSGSAQSSRRHSSGSASFPWPAEISAIKKQKSPMAVRPPGDFCHLGATRYADAPRGHGLDAQIIAALT